MWGFVSSTATTPWRGKEHRYDCICSERRGQPRRSASWSAQSAIGAWYLPRPNRRNVRRRAEWCHAGGRPDCGGRAAAGRELAANSPRRYLPRQRADGWLADSEWPRQPARPGELGALYRASGSAEGTPIQGFKGALHFYRHFVEHRPATAVRQRPKRATP